MEPQTWVTVAMALVATIGAITTSVVTYLSSRDKLRFDADVKSLKESIAKCERDCHDNREKAQDAISRREQAELKTAKMEGELLAADKELRELRQERRELLDRLHGVAK